MINMPVDRIKQRICEKTNISMDELNTKIKAKLSQLSGLISEEGAAHIVANELGVKLFDSAQKIKVKDILLGMRNLEFDVSVVQKYELREYTTDKGSGKVANILVGDETGILRLVMWHKQADLINEVKEGDVLNVKNGYVKENNGRYEVHVGELAKIIINPPGITINVKPRSVGADLGDVKRKTISEISEGDSNVEVLATLVQVFDINFFEVCPNCSKRVKMDNGAFNCPVHGPVAPNYNYVLNAYIDDGTDNMRVVFWKDQVMQLLSMNDSQITVFKEEPFKFENVKNDLLGNIIKVIGRANKNMNFDRIELVANNVIRNPNPSEEMKHLDAQPKMASSKP